MTWAETPRFSSCSHFESLVDPSQEKSWCSLQSSRKSTDLGQQVFSLGLTKERADKIKQLLLFL